MNAPSPMSYQLTFWDTPSAISLPASADGPSLSASPDGRTTAPSGPAPAPASRSARPGRVWAERIRAIYGRRSVASSTGAALQSSLESRLQARMAAAGSPEYSLTWKRWDLPRRDSISALRASARRTSDNASGGSASGWPTPTARNSTGASETETREGAADLQTVAGWATPTTRDHKDTVGMATTGINPDGSERSRLDQLGRQVGLLAGWPTPMAGTPAQNGNNEAGNNDSSRKAVEVVSGMTPDSSSAGTENTAGYQLNPRFSLWLMGYPTAWHDVGVSALRSSREQATPSSRNSRRSSSKRSTKRKEGPEL